MASRCRSILFVKRSAWGLRCWPAWGPVSFPDASEAVRVARREELTVEPNQGALQRLQQRYTKFTAVFMSNSEKRTINCTISPHENGEK